MLAKILVVEDQRVTRRMVALCFGRYEGWSVREAESLQDAISALREDSFDAIVLDLNLKDSEGIATLDTVAALTVAPIIIFSGHLDDALKAEATAKNVCAWIEKKVGTEHDLQDAVVGCISRRRMMNGSSGDLTVPKGLVAKTVVWLSSVGGTLIFLALVGAEIAVEGKAWRPKQWQIDVVYAALFGAGSAAVYHAAKRK